MAWWWQWCVRLKLNDYRLIRDIQGVAEGVAWDWYALGVVDDGVGDSLGLRAEVSS